MTQTHKLLFLLETGDLGGCQTVIRTIAQHARANGHSVCLGLGQPGPFAEMLISDGFDVRVLKAGREVLGFDLQALRSLDSLVRSFQPTVIHAFLFHMNFYGSVIGAVRGVPAIISLRSKHYDFEKRRRRLAWKLMYRLAKKTTAASDDLADVLSQRCNIDRRTIQVISNGVDTNRFCGFAPRVQLKRELGIPENHKLITSVGRMNPVKGHEDFMEAMAILRPRFHDIACAVVGAKEEPVYGNILARCASLEPELPTFFPGITNNVPTWLAATDYFVLPSHSEGMSNALLEAMASRLPIVATDVGSNRQLLEDGKCGLLYLPETPKALQRRSLPSSPPRTCA